MNELTVGLIGMPGVGKTTLFNCICCSKNITSCLSQTTADVVFGLGKLGTGWFGSYRIADTVGWKRESPKHIPQLLELVKQANALILVLDSRIGVTKDDRSIIKRLNENNKLFWVVANKADPGDVVRQQLLNQQGNTAFVSASHGVGVKGMLFRLLKAISKTNVVNGAKVLESKQVAVAVVGQRNTGKSTLVNSVVRDCCVRTSRFPGTTKDRVVLAFDFGQQQFRFIDTAGYSSWNSCAKVTDRQSVLQSFQAISKANIVLLVVSVQSGPSRLDLNVMGYSKRSRKSLVLVYNKHDRSNYRVASESKLKQHNLRECFVSAIRLRGINTLVHCVKMLAGMLCFRATTHTLSGILRSSVIPMLKQTRKQDGLRLSCVHQGGTNPPIFVVHGRNVNLLSKRCAARIANVLRTKLHLNHIHIGIRLVNQKG